MAPEAAEALAITSSRLKTLGLIDKIVPEPLGGAAWPKFRSDGLWFVHAGGTAGMFSAIIGGWINGETGSQPVTKEVRS